MEKEEKTKEKRHYTKPDKIDKKFVEKCEKHNYDPGNIISSVLRRDYESRNKSEVF